MPDFPSTVAHEVPQRAISTPSSGPGTPDELDVQDADSVEGSPIFDYLRSSQGHEIAKGILGIIQDIKKAAIEHSASNTRMEKVLQVGIVFVVVVATTVLATIGKLDTPVGILFGTLVGYVFGRRS